MNSRLLVSGLPRSLPPLPPSPASPCLPCVEGRQRAAPHSSSFPPTTAPLQTLHMDVWGPARISGQSRERYFLLVVDDYTRYTTVFPFRSKGQIIDVLIPWIRTVRLQLCERFGQDLPVLRLHSDRGGEFSSTLMRDFCRGEGILQSFTLLDSPQQNGIVERRIGLVMEVARTSMIHAAAPHFLLPFAVRSGDLVPLFAIRLRTSSSPRAIPCVFLGFVPDAPGWQFYHPTSRRVFPSQDVTFDESVPFYRLFPYRLFPYRSSMLPVDPLPSPAPVEVPVDSGAARGAASGGAESEGAEIGGAEPGGVAIGGAAPGGVAPGGFEPGGAVPASVEPEGAESEVAESGGAEPQGAALSGGCAGASPRLSPQQLREWFVRCSRLRSGASGAGGAGAIGAGGPGVAAGAGVTGVYGLRQAPRDWHDTLRTTLAALRFATATAHPSLFLRTDTSLPPFYVLLYVFQRFGFQFSSPQPTPLSTSHSLSAPPSDESVEPSGLYPELVGCLMYLMTCTRPDLAYPLSLQARYVAPGRQRKVHWDVATRVLRYLCSTSGMGLVLGGCGPVVLTSHVDASWLDDSATQRSSQGYTFSLSSGSVSWRSTRSSLVLSSSCEAEIYAGAMAAQELLWITYLLTDMGEQPRSPLVLYVDNKAMIALCQEHRQEHRTKHIALRYFLARELQ
ncbi:unnamed protein product [Closterium sp. NIES-53]